MSDTTQDHIRAAAARLVEQARARGNRLCLTDAEEGVRASLALKARGIPATAASAATAVAAVDREAIRHLTTICKILPSLGKDPTRLKAALEGHFPPDLVWPDGITPAEAVRSRAAPRATALASDGYGDGGRWDSPAAA